MSSVFLQWMGGSVCGLTVGFTSYHKLLLQKIFWFLNWFKICFSSNFQEMEFFVHQNILSSLTVAIIVVFIHVHFLIIIPQNKSFFFGVNVLDVLESVSICLDLLRPKW